MKKSSLLLVCCFFVYVAAAQHKQKAELDSLKQYVKSTVIKLMEVPRISRFHKTKFRSNKFLFIPYCMFKAGKNMDCKDILDSVYIPKTTLDVSYNINYVNDSIIVLPFIQSSEATSLFIDTSIKNYGYIADKRTYNMYKLARKKSKYCFILRVFPGYGNLVGFRNVMAYIDGRKLKIISIKGYEANGEMLVKYFDSFQDYINDRYGSFQAYWRGLQEYYANLSEDMIY